MIAKMTISCKWQLAISIIKWLDSENEAPGVKWLGVFLERGEGGGYLGFSLWFAGLRL